MRAGQEESAAERAALDKQAERYLPLVGMIYVDGEIPVKWCSAVLLSGKVVMTTEMCIHERTVETLRFVPEGKSEPMNVAAILIHPSLKYSVMEGNREIEGGSVLATDGDVALLQLTSPVTLPANIKYPTITDDDRLAIGELALTIGYGETGDVTKDEALAKGKWQGSRVANLKHYLTDQITGHFFFTFADQFSKQIPCKGDGGAPLFLGPHTGDVQPKLVGIIAYTRAFDLHCGKIKSTYAVRLSEYKGWIDSHRNGWK